MRVVVAVLVGLLGVAAVGAQEAKPAKRYGVEPSLDVYPQGSPRETLASVLKAIEEKRIDYLLAHLADPQFVDKRVQTLGGKFEELVQETRVHLLDDPGAVKELRRFLHEGEWETAESTASARLKDVKDRRVFLRKIGPRWFLENRKKPDGEGK
jgi:uroporphyrinogen-III synthase